MRGNDEKTVDFYRKLFAKKAGNRRKKRQTVLDFQRVLMYNLLVRFYAIEQCPGGVSKGAEIRRKSMAFVAYHARR